MTDSAPDLSRQIGNQSVAGVFVVGDTYDAQCPCGWEATGFEDTESAAEVLRLHQGDDHCPDCGGIVQFGDDCLECPAEGEHPGRSPEDG